MSPNKRFTVQAWTSIYLDWKFIMQEFTPANAAHKAATTDHENVEPGGRKYHEFHQECGKSRYRKAYLQCRKQVFMVKAQLAKHLDPNTGTGFGVLNLTKVVPKFLHPQHLPKFPWPEKGTWAFAGDPTFGHHVSLSETPTLLRKIVGPENFTELVAFGEAVTDTFNEILPAEELRRMLSRNVRLGLDFGEIRVEDGSGTTPGGRVHIDWERGEAMVLVIPLEGNHPTIFPQRIVEHQTQTAGVKGYLLTGKARWETFHNPSAEQRQQWVTIEEYGYPVSVPRGMVRYRDELAACGFEDMHLGYPGVIPTVHRGDRDHEKF